MSDVVRPRANASSSVSARSGDAWLRLRCGLRPLILAIIASYSQGPPAARLSIRERSSCGLIPMARANVSAQLSFRLRRRHVYGSTDNILADVRSGQHMMGDAFTTSTLPE